MSSWTKIHDLQTIQRDKLVATDEQKAIEIKYKRRLSVIHTSDLATDEDLGLRTPICEYNVNIRDQVRRAYFQRGPCQPSGYEFLKRKFEVSQCRQFNPSWFNEFGDWLSSVEKDAAYCLYCYLFKTAKGKQAGGEAFVNEGFTNWKCKDWLNIHVGQHETANIIKLE
ncbi:uncharacterized protein [Primulina eburnea]|uniref:uncharacterized protein n=1 Tax=Primulina eburnea TaxID=1245227 RepID=UPI003C6C0387